MPAKLRQIWEEVLRDRRKLFALSAVLLIGMLFWGRLIFVKKVPRTAVADPDAKTAANTGDNTPGPASLLDRPVLTVSAPMGLDRDLFAFEGGPYELIDPSSPGSPGQRKYGQGRADNEQLLRELKARYDRMRLQTTFLVGEQWQAIIDGRFFKAGDEHDGFTIVKVRSREVLLEVQGMKVWLKMDKR